MNWIRPVPIISSGTWGFAGLSGGEVSLTLARSAGVPVVPAEPDPAELSGGIASLGVSLIGGLAAQEKRISARQRQAGKYSIFIVIFLKINSNL